MRTRRIVGGLLAAALCASASLAWHARRARSAAVPALRAPAATLRQRAPMASANDGAVSDVDLFAARQWAPSPGEPRAQPASRLTPPPAPTGPSATPPPVFDVAAVWRFDSRPPVVVLERHGQTWLLCEACDAPGRVAPGDTFDGEYRLDRIDAQSLTYTRKTRAHRTTLPLPMPRRDLAGAEPDVRRNR
ncbi:hypothetical protein PMO31116_01297 [Pandoraea morbifera]|uniref:Lipoprotein n=1 Tax=Pandoraea morbifera TaxID=2508300 RepID=A0A5E4TDR0_9BURK|nr:hypothetical protein PMO31116_01297 [Pandoraea morbifera]